MIGVCYSFPKCLLHCIFIALETEGAEAAEAAADADPATLTGLAKANAVLAKIRAGESIYRTRNGDVHSPGGTSYYAAVWCNDQAEYAGPWQAWTGDGIQLGAAYNGYCAAPACAIG